MAIRNLGTERNPNFEVRVCVRSRLNYKQTVNRSRRGIRTEREAKRVEAVLKGEALEAARLYRPERYLWINVVEAWRVDLQTKESLGEDTINTYYSRLRANTFEPWAKFHIENITGDCILLLIQTKAEEKSHKSGSKDNLRKAIASVIDFAMRKGVVSENPASRVKIKQKKRKDLNIWTTSQLIEFLQHVKKKNERDHRLYYFATLTLMRLGEILGLKWDKVDVNKRQIHVSASYSQNLALLKPFTKSGKHRIIPINIELKDLVNTLSFHRDKDDPFVFPRKIYNPKRKFAMELKKYSADLKFLTIRFHDFRAMGAIAMLQSKQVDALQLQKIGGWTDWATMNFYLRMAGVSLEGATDSFALLPNAPTKQNPWAASAPVPTPSKRRKRRA
jgi:integrase